MFKNEKRKQDSFSKFARRDTYDSISLFYDVILYGREIKTLEEKEEIEASYLAMCWLLPTEEFDLVIKSFGGLESAYKEHRKIERIAKIFNVEEQLVRCRIKERMNDEKNLLSEDTKSVEEVDLNEEKSQETFKTILAYQREGVIYTDEEHIKKSLDEESSVQTKAKFK